MERRKFQLKGEEAPKGEGAVIKRLAREIAELRKGYGNDYDRIKKAVEMSHRAKGMHFSSFYFDKAAKQCGIVE